MNKERFSERLATDRCLRSTGKACFVKHFDAFTDLRVSNDDLIDLLMKSEGYMESGSRTRVLQSRRIINSGRGRDALNLIASSERVPEDIRRRARKLSNELG